MKPKDLKSSDELVSPAQDDAGTIENPISDVVLSEPEESGTMVNDVNPLDVRDKNETVGNQITEDSTEPDIPDISSEKVTGGAEDLLDDVTIQPDEAQEALSEPVSALQEESAEIKEEDVFAVPDSEEEPPVMAMQEENSEETPRAVLSSPEVEEVVPAVPTVGQITENQVLPEVETPVEELVEEVAAETEEILPSTEQPSVSIADDDLSDIISIKEDAEIAEDTSGDLNDSVDLSELISPREEITETSESEITKETEAATEPPAGGYLHPEEENHLLEGKSELSSSSAYLELSQVELINLLRSIVEGQTDEEEHDTDAIVAVYYRKAKEKSDEAKRKFLADGGKPEDYNAEEDPYSQEVRDLVRKFRQMKFDQARKLDLEKEANLRKKYELIEEIKNLLNKEESINRTFQEFRELQKKWYEIGQVPQNKMKDIWDTYHFHVENFYDYIKINKELRDLDLKKNLELKIELCEKAEELLVEPSIIKAFNSLQKFHEEWREIGPVPSDKKEEIWERFKATTSKINQKHQDYFEKRKLDQKKNLDAKIALCEKAEEICSGEFESHREWDDKSRDLVELQKVWKTIGFAPKKENNKVYDRFRAACDKFFAMKREYYSRNKDVQQTNLQMKVDLCLEAETLKESADWKKATQQFIDIQKRWKEIGPVPRKSSDAIWKRFRAACDYFFEKKAIHFSEIDGEQYENLKLKEQIIAEVENFKPDNDPAVSLKMLRDYQRRWTEIGHVPLKSKDVIQRRFREAINKQFDSLKVDYQDRSSFNFRNKIEALTDNVRGLSKVRSEREKYMAKLKQLETDLSLLDNNIGFFANSKNAQALIADVNQKIIDTREKIEQLKDKIRIIDELDKSEY